MNEFVDLRSPLLEAELLNDVPASLDARDARAAVAHVPPLDLSLVIPTYNEALNIRELLHRLDVALKDLNWEVVFVDDDSPDSTADLVRQLARATPHIRVLQRIGRRGLSTACIEGMLATSAPVIAVMDADLQHDETLLPRMHEKLRAEPLDIVIASRYAQGGGTGTWSAERVMISGIATRLGRMVLRAELSDPMSGFFMLRREAFMSGVRRLSGVGFKILFDIFASTPQKLRYAEVPYTFRPRHAGASKLDSKVVWDYLMLLLDKLIGDTIPIRFVIFCIVGLLGLAVHLAAMALLHKVFALGFGPAQGIAAFAALTSNFAFNNYLTFSDQRLKGWGLLKGWFTFALSCSVGMVANIGIASYLHNQDGFWVSSAIAGVLVGAVWNYAVSSVFTWKKPRGA